jgi:hypothetical protein
MATLTLTPTQEAILRQRYMRLLRLLEARCVRTSLLFHSSRIIITVGSLLVPALLSIQYTGDSMEGSEMSLRIYWATWFVSLLVTMCNGLLTLFKLDKRYFFLHTTLEQLISEGWQYIELTAKYSGFYTPGRQPTHENQFLFFCHAVEKIRMRQVEEEYFKLSELHSHPVGQGTRSSGPAEGAAAPASSSSAAPIPSHSALSSLIPPTPLSPEAIASLPPELRRFIEEQLSRGREGEDGGRESQAQNQESEEHGSTTSVPVRGEL